MHEYLGANDERNSVRGAAGRSTRTFDVIFFFDSRRSFGHGYLGKEIVMRKKEDRVYSFVERERSE